ncbi:hypothetical protein NY08_409 [Rhodococcus sp. B7740]|nr:hypothetical protein NY08_409 [Rhodococcus sp. B7740]
MIRRSDRRYTTIQPGTAHAVVDHRELRSGHRLGCGARPNS